MELGSRSVYSACRAGPATLADGWRARTLSDLSLDDYYDEGAVARDREGIASVNRRVGQRYQDHASAWSGAVTQLNAAVGTEVQRFTRAMKRATPRKQSPPGASLRLHRRPLGLGYSAVWYWRLGRRINNEKAAGELIVTSRGRISVAYIAKMGTRGFDGSGGKLLREMPKRLFEIPKMEVPTSREQAAAIAARLNSYPPVQPPTPDEVSQRLAQILQEHSVTL